MTSTEFLEVTTEIERFYGKELTTEQQKIWFEELKKISKERYRQVSREIYKTSKFMPKLADIVEANTSLPLITKVKTKNDCNKCKGTGIIIYKKTIEDYSYEYGARCDCLNGLIISKKIPMVSEIGLQ